MSASPYDPTWLRRMTANARTTNDREEALEALNHIEVLEAEVERLERYLFAARANITALESGLKAVTAARDAYAEEVSRLAHRLAALEGT